MSQQLVAIQQFPNRLQMFRMTGMAVILAGIFLIVLALKEMQHKKGNPGKHAHHTMEKLERAHKKMHTGEELEEEEL